MSSNTVLLPSPVKLEVLRPSNCANIPPTTITSGANVITKVITGSNTNVATLGGRGAKVPVKSLSTLKYSTVKIKARQGGISTGLSGLPTKTTSGVSVKSEVPSSPNSSSPAPLKPRTPLHPPLLPASTLPLTTTPTGGSVSLTAPTYTSPTATSPTHTFSALVKASPGSSSCSASSSTSPSTSNSFSSPSVNSPLKCRRRISYAKPVVTPMKSISRRNARERNRVRQVSQGFAMLRQHIPQAQRKKKLSKVETLRCAVDYIRGLQLLLEDHPAPGGPTHGHGPSVAHTGVHVLGSDPVDMFHQSHVAPALDPHILKLPEAENRFVSSVALRYDNMALYYRPSPATSNLSVISSTTVTPSIVTSSNSNPPGDLTATVCTTDDSKAYPKIVPTNVDEHDLLEALAWWQNNNTQP